MVPEQERKSDYEESKTAIRICYSEICYCVAFMVLQPASRIIWSQQRKSSRKFSHCAASSVIVIDAVINSTCLMTQNALKSGEGKA